MILKGIVILCILCTVSGKHVKTKKEDYPPLKWPSKYSVEATKYYMSSGLVEHYKYWKSYLSSRMEVDDGAVIEVVQSKNIFKAKKYEVHFETTEKETNKIVCFMEEKSNFAFKEFLPHKGLSAEGEDNVKGIDCVKFASENKIYYFADIITAKSLWAYYNDSFEHWVPVRYELKSFNTWHGYFIKHEIWDYSNFKNTVDRNTFKLTYNCTKKDDDDELTRKSSVNYLSSEKPEQSKELKGAFSTLVTKTTPNQGYKLALNQRSDRTEEQLKNRSGLKRDKPKIRVAGNLPFPYSEKRVKKIAASLPKEYDLRLQGLVGPVLNEEDCRSSWAFAATAVVEGALARSKGGTLRKLSEQALLDCSWGFGNKGCAEGTDTGSYQWIMEHGLPTEQEYGSYANKNGFCKIENITNTYKIKGYTDVTPFNVEALKVALVNHGPISVNINYINTLIMYDGGIFYDPDCKPDRKYLDQMMTLVGYGEKDGDTYWILKNSMGPYWGIDGYVYISAKDNNCGVMTEPSYVVA